MSLDKHELDRARIAYLTQKLEEAYDELAEAEFILAERDATIGSLTVEIQRMVADRTYVAA